MRPAAYKRYLLILLMGILAFNFTDRLAFGIVLQDIKTDLNLTDTELGFLGGIAFALFYAVMGIPIARWADRGNRVAIITLTTALWSAMVVLCAMAGSFVQLMLVRVGVAVGEAGCLPPAHSLIADYFTRAERPRAVGIYTMGAPMSGLFGFFAAGWLNELYGWRVTFFILGLPGLVLAALAWATLKEPRQSAATLAAPAAQPRMTEVWVALWSNITFRRILLCVAVSNFFMYGMVQWEPAFFIRSFGMRTGEIGTWFALCTGVSVLGTYLGGALASRYAAHNERHQLLAMALLFALNGVMLVCVYLASNQYWALAFLALSGLVHASTNGPIFATIQTLIPERMRAVSVALVLLFANLIGLGFGPMAAGALSDALRPALGEESLRYALLALCPGYLWCTWYMWRASQSVVQELAVVRA
jgi:MFS family permease